MRVIHVVPAIADEASGPSYSVPRLCESLIAAGTDVQLAALDWSPVPVSLPYLKTFPLGFGPRSLGASPSMRKWLTAEVDSGRAELIHNHSLWMMPNVYAGQVCRTGHSRLMVSPRGTLSDWALRRSALRKRIFWRWCQEPAIRSTACFHATADSEYEDIRRVGFSQPVCILPNGVDVPEFITTRSEGRRQLLFLGRIHPKKGVDMLLRAWDAVAQRFPDWELHVAGPGCGSYRTEMEALAVKMRAPRVVFSGPLFGAEKLRAYRAASLFVLPTHSENFGMTVAEALAAGTPTIVTKGAPWADLEKHSAGWWIDIGVDPLVACLEVALASQPATLAEMGQAGRDWMLRDYSWDQIGTKFASTYLWILNGGVTPPWVRVN